MVKVTFDNSIILECFYPNSGEINPIILDIIENSLPGKPMYKAVTNKITQWNLEREFEQNFILNNFLNYIFNILNNNFDNYNRKLKLVSSWGVICDKGDYIMPHNHGGSDYSFVYYVNAPKGSSPLLFPTFDYKIVPEQGKLVLFTASLIHEVPKNISKKRISLIGNISSV